MIEFALGVIVGCAITATVWFMLFNKTTTIFVQTQDKKNIVAPVPMAVKPDNKKVAFYASADYRNERKFVEENKKSESIS